MLTSVKFFSKNFEKVLDIFPALWYYIVTGKETLKERKVRTMMNINNMPATARTWIVAREVDGELWYYGSWEEKEKAQEVAYDVGGVMVENEG